MLGAETAATERVAELAAVLKVDLEWQLGYLSDGQLRRAQILIGLSKFRPFIILDEITTDIDLLIRDALLKYLKKESIEQGTCIIYATHIFDGMEEWEPSYILRLRQ